MNSVLNSTDLSQTVILCVIQEDKLFDDCFRGSKKKKNVSGTTERTTKRGSKVKLPANDLYLNYLIEPII